MESKKNPFEILVEEFRVVVREEIAKALHEKRPPQLLYKTKEVAAMLNLQESWIATAARAGKIPSRMFGKYRVFSAEDVKAIIEQAAVKKEGD